MASMAKSSKAASTLVLLLLVVCVVTYAPRSTLAASGTATYYTVYTPSSCYGFDTSPFPAGPLIAAASSAIFNNKAACGNLYQISCTGNGCTGGGPITVKVVDLCPGCAANQFDLSQEAFSQIANIDVGRINIEYNQV
ncbi:hypothetical protein GOP47_0010470 [Adiantum capillus-veneris]|uniref:Expansin-like EG45 domain-containing protein n=1 Tax=Adiantum capillus-veneris TaxID=13818 RepID=A0A9D4UUY9_ADICA|nr:hypothetical protein GOP47_0010470 [Adiantum capillus-veneris]